MRYVTRRHMSEDERLRILNHIMKNEMKGTVHDTIQLPKPIGATDFRSLPDPQMRSAKLKWPITPLREVYGNLVDKGYEDLDFHSRVTPFPVDPKTDRNYLIGPETSDGVEDDAKSDSSAKGLSRSKYIGLRRLTSDFKGDVAGDDIPEGYTQVRSTADKTWDVLYIPRKANDLKDDLRPIPIVARRTTRDGLMKIFKTSESFYILGSHEKGAGEEALPLQPMTSLSSSERKKFEWRTTSSSTEAKKNKIHEESGEIDEGHRNYAQGFGISLEALPTKANTNKFINHLKDAASRLFVYGDQAITDKEIFQLYNNGYLAIPDLAPPEDQKTECLRALITRVLEGDDISDEDLLALYNYGFLALDDDKMPTANDALLAIVACVKEGEDVTCDELRQLYDADLLLLIINGEMLTEKGMKILIARAISKQEVTAKKVRFMWMEGMVDLRPGGQFFTNSELTAIKSNLENFSEDDLNAICSLGLHGLPMPVIDKFVNNEMRVLLHDEQKKQVSEDLLYRLFYKGFTETSDPLKRALFEDSEKDSVTFQWKKPRERERFVMTDTEAMREQTSEEHAPQGLLPVLSHASDLENMLMKSLAGQKGVIGDSCDHAINQMCVGRTKYFRGPQYGMSGGSGRGAAMNKARLKGLTLSHDAQEKVLVRKKRPESAEDKPIRTKYYCHACFLQKKPLTVSECKAHENISGKKLESDLAVDLTKSRETDDRLNTTHECDFLSKTLKSRDSMDATVTKEFDFMGRTSKTEQQPERSITIGEFVAAVSKQHGIIDEEENQDRLCQMKGILQRRTEEQDKMLLAKFYSPQRTLSITGKIDGEMQRKTLSRSSENKESSVGGRGETDDILKSQSMLYTGVGVSSATDSRQGSGRKDVQSMLHSGVGAPSATDSRQGSGRKDVQSMLFSGVGAPLATDSRQGSGRKYDARISDEQLYRERDRIESQKAKKSSFEKGLDLTDTNTVKVTGAQFSIVDGSLANTLLTDGKFFGLMDKVQREGSVHDAKKSIATPPKKFSIRSEERAISSNKSEKQRAKTQPLGITYKERTLSEQQIEKAKRIGPRERETPQTGVLQFTSHERTPVQDFSEGETMSRHKEHPKEKQHRREEQRKERSTFSADRYSDTFTRGSTGTGTLLSQSSDKRSAYNVPVARERKMKPSKEMLAVSKKKKESTLSPDGGESPLSTVGVEVVGKKAAPPTAAKVPPGLPKYSKFQGKQKQKHYSKTQKQSIQPKVMKKAILSDRVNVTQQPRLSFKSRDVRNLKVEGRMEDDDEGYDEDLPDFVTQQAMDEMEMKEMLEHAGVIETEAPPPPQEETKNLLDSMFEDDQTKEDIEEELQFDATAGLKTIADLVAEQAKAIKEIQEPSTEASEVTEKPLEDFAFQFGKPPGLSSPRKMLSGRIQTDDEILYNPEADHHAVMDRIKDSIIRTKNKKATYMDFLHLDVENAPWFEFPVNLEELNDMHPRVYMKKYCIINPRRQEVYSKIFKKYCESNRMITRKRLLLAVNELLIGNYSHQQMDGILGLLQVDHKKEFDSDLFLSITCLAERLADKTFESDYPPPRNFLAELDETLVVAHLDKLTLNQPLYHLLKAIIGDD